MPGTRDPERTRVVPVERACARAPVGVLCTTEERAAVRLLPHQLGRARPERQLPHLGAEHPNAVRHQPTERCDPMAPRREAERLRDGPRDDLQLAAWSALARTGHSLSL